MPDSDEISAELGRAPETIGGVPAWWLRDAPEASHRRALSLGLTEDRRLHQMRRPLPAPAAPADVVLRPFRPGLDDAEWLTVNNAAFAGHPDQGSWTLDDLRGRLSESWFEAGGFLVHENGDGHIDGSCWTRYHPDSDPASGEIYVIGTAPGAQGHGLGRALVLGGLAWQWEHHRPPVGTLYVEHDNSAAIGLYRRLGFEIHHDDVSYVLAGAGSAGGATVTGLR